MSNMDAVDRISLVEIFNPDIRGYIEPLLIPAGKFSWLGPKGLKLEPTFDPNGLVFKLDLAGLDVFVMIDKSGEFFDVKVSKERVADYVCSQVGHRDILSIWKKNDNESLVKVVQVLLNLLHDFHMLEFANLYRAKYNNMKPMMQSMEEALANGIITRLLLKSTRDQANVAYTGQLDAVDFTHLASKFKLKDFSVEEGDYDLYFEVRVKANQGLSHISYRVGKGINFLCRSRLRSVLKSSCVDLGSESKELEEVRHEFLIVTMENLARLQQRKNFVKSLKAALGNKVTDVDELFLECRVVLPSLQKCTEIKLVEEECQESISKEDTSMMSPVKEGAATTNQEGQNACPMDTEPDVCIKVPPEDHNANFKAVMQKSLIKSCKVVLEVPTFSLEKKAVCNVKIQDRPKPRRFKFSAEFLKQDVEMEEETKTKDVALVENPADASPEKEIKRQVFQIGSTKEKRETGAITMDFDLTEFPDKCPAIRMKHQPSGIERDYEGQTIVEETEGDYKEMVNNFVDKFMAQIVSGVLKDATAGTKH